MYQRVVLGVRLNRRTWRFVLWLSFVIAFHGLGVHVFRRRLIAIAIVHVEQQLVGQCGPMLAQTPYFAQHVHHQVLGALIELVEVLQHGYVGQRQCHVHVKQTLTSLRLAHELVQEVNDTSIQKWIVAHKTRQNVAQNVGRVRVGVQIVH
jgi:hypothetical protein